METAGVMMAGIQDYIQNFQFVVGVTPLSTFQHVVGAVALYLTVLFVLTKVMAGRKPMKLRLPLAIHNLTLTAFSFVAFCAVVYYMVPIWYSRGTYVVSCDPNREIYSRGPVVFWFYLFYLSKMYEFLDTVFQVLKKKNLLFLHVYHHCVTLVLVWVTIREDNPMQWADISANLFVHVIMYYYYFITDFYGSVVWWKRYITTIQIIQFVWDLAWHAGWYYVYTKTPDVCSGTYMGFMVANFIIVSFLLLFIRFYFSAYKPKPKAKAQ
jgi:fatty acid elongase 3